jgi:hypothetical protein
MRCRFIAMKDVPHGQRRNAIIQPRPRSESEDEVMKKAQMAIEEVRRCFLACRRSLAFN